MTKEDRELLLKDLCARLHFGVYVNYKNIEGRDGIVRLNPYNIQHIYSDWWKECKPYLRPLSSMTEGERKEYEHIAPGIEVENGVRIPNVNQIDYLNSIYVDYRGLIERGLAIAVTEENNPYKN